MERAPGPTFLWKLRMELRLKKVSETSEKDITVNPMTISPNLIRHRSRP